MFKNYLKIAFRNMVKNKIHSFINIAGLSAGMAVAILIGLWIWNELSFDKQNRHYERIAQVYQNQTFNGKIDTWFAMPFPLSEVLRHDYGGNFKYVVMSSWTQAHILATADRKLTREGNFMEEHGPDIMDLQMEAGSSSLKDPNTILLSKSTARAIFGDADPMNKLIRVDNQLDVKVGGIYQDPPDNSSFARVGYVIPWAVMPVIETWIKKMDYLWGNNICQVFVELGDHVNIDQAAASIRNAKLNNIRADEKKFQPLLHLQPMKKWHLYGEFKNGVNTGGDIRFIWLFGVIGAFVLLLACINFMNLSTARSEKRAKEVGIRKSIGSQRNQLILQFFSESLSLSFLSLVMALLLVQLLLPAFNSVADKKTGILWTNPFFWLLCIVFCIITGLIAGSYPALYLSSFRPVKVLKGTFRAGRNAAIPRKVLVVTQFCVSIILIIGTTVIFREIQFARNRPVGYSREGLVAIRLYTLDIHNHFDVVRNELKNTNAIVEMAESASALTNVASTSGGFEWTGKDPSLAVDFPNNGVSYDYGQTVGWQFKAGRDFSRDFASDTAAFVVNESAVKFMGLKDPIGEVVKWGDRPFRIIGVIHDMIVENPYQAVRPSFYYMTKMDGNFAVIRMNPARSANDAIAQIKTIFEKFSPAQPFDYQFVNLEYARKFSSEERDGKLAGFFAGLAILISCLGLFGMASFMAEQRTKEIGIRKILGASVLSLWHLLSRDFVILVVIAMIIATPLSYQLMHNWLSRYDYQAGIPWWIFVLTGSGALLITLLTVSYQAVRAALRNPAKTLKTD